MEPEGVSCISEDLADNSREECLPQTAVAKISAHAAGKGYPRLTFAGSVADVDLCKGAGLAEGKSGSKWLRSSTRRGAAGAAQAAKAPVGFFNAGAAKSPPPPLSPRASSEVTVGYSTI